MTRSGRVWRRGAAAVLAAVVGAIAVVRGVGMCLCSVDPDDCGSACHACGEACPDGLSADEPCSHLVLDVPDCQAMDTAVHVPAVAELPRMTVSCVRADSGWDLPRQVDTGPPRRGWMLQLYSRMCPRS